MEAKLLDSLHHRLGELEGQIQARRRELIADFQHYCRDLLLGVPPDTVSSVHRALAASLSDYPTLRPELMAAESRLPETPTLAAFQPSAPSAVSGRADAPGSPRERENELRGLFTPTYLPLLDSSPNLPKAVLAGPLGADATPGQGQVAPMDGTKEQSKGQRDAPDHPPPPFSAPARRNDSTQSIDDTRSSVSSDKSDSKPARSALRRSSSISKPPQSPRRVRFEFMGAEVLPTASPQPPQFMDPRPCSPDPNDDSSDAAFDSNLGDDTTEEEHFPPRKVSSSDALRALSRTPLEAGPVWTVVNADTDDVAAGQQETGLDQNDVLPPSFAASRTIPESSRETTLEHPEKDQVETSDGDVSSDDDFLAMTKRKDSNKKPILPPLPHSAENPVPGSVATTAGQTSEDAPHTNTAEDEIPTMSDDGEPEDDDDMFHFEAGGLSAPPRPRPRPQPSKEEEYEDPQPKDGDSMAPSEGDTDNQVSIYATSPAVHIQRSPGSRAASARFQQESVGSYKGRPLLMPVVKDPEVLEQVKAAGPSRWHFAGMDGETVMAEGSLPHFSPSVPLSFKERFIMEEIMEQPKLQTEEKKGGVQ